MMHRARWSTALLALLAGLACDQADGDTIYIGVAGPLSMGPGISMQNAAVMAAEEINQNGGIDGRSMELIFRDDEASAERAIEVALDLRDDARISAVVGHINSGATLAAADVYNDEENGVVEISPASSSPRISEAGPWTFRVCPTDLQHGPALARWAYDRLEARQAAVLYANDDYGRGVLSSFGEAFQAAGGTVLERDPFLPTDDAGATSLDPYLERAIRDGMDALMIAGQAEEALRIIRSARRLGFTGPVLGADGLTGIRDGGQIAEGTFVSSAYLPDRPDADSRAFVRAYEARYGSPPDHRAAMTYDAVRLLARVIDEVGPDRRAVRDHLATVGGERPAFDGVSGDIGFDSNGDVMDKEVAIGVVHDGRLVTPDAAPDDPAAVADGSSAPR